MASPLPESLTFSMISKGPVVRTSKHGSKRCVGQVVVGQLIWGADVYAVRSGPYAQGALPTGTYTVDWAHLSEGSAIPGHKIKAGMTFTTPVSLKTSGKILNSADKTNAKRELTGFAVPIIPDFETSRDGLFIHPDGNAFGTQGCVGLVGADAERFWQKVLSTAMSRRPAKLLVMGQPVAQAEYVLGTAPAVGAE